MSGRPSTPPPSSSAPHQPCRWQRKGQNSRSSYEPSLFDLVYAYGRKNQDLGGRLPSTFLESASVDGARTLGSGASFTASLRKLPQGPKTLSSTTSYNGTVITRTWSAPPRPEFVVFKVAKVSFDSSGKPLPQYKAAMQSVLTEIHTLLYPPLFEHPNVVDVLGVAWGTNPFDHEKRLPALVLEYADQGTLSEVLKGGKTSSAEKRVLCFDIACGLQALHDAGLIHGDIKADNVLCFTSPERRVAKLGDFGFSIVAESEDTELWLGGTKPWQAPEVQHAVPVSEARYTDIYSYGLLVWSVALDGENMFRKFCNFDQAADKWDEEVEEFKTTASMAQLCHTSTWVPIHLRQMADSIPGYTQADQSSTEGPQQAWKAFVESHELVSIMDELLSLTLDVRPLERNLTAARDLLHAPHTEIMVRSTSPQHLLSYKVTNNTDEDKSLSFTPIGNEGVENKSPLASMPQVSCEKSSSKCIRQSHDRPVIDDPSIQAEALDGIEKQAMIDYDRLSWGRRGFKHTWLSWQDIRDLAPALQCLMFKAYASREAAGDDAAGLFLLTSLLVNGYGHCVDYEHACRVLRRSADLGNANARAYLYRLHISLGISSVPGEDITQYLRDYGLHGYRAARNGYRPVLSQDATHEMTPHHIRLYMDAYGGVGADWYDVDNMLHGLTQSEWIKDEFLISQAAVLANITEYKVNKRGDSLLHFAAACGRIRSLKVLLGKYSFEVNMRNSAGDTPLICAARSGHFNATILLLEEYDADASCSAHNGETALHWLCGLISYFEYSMHELAQSMITHGAETEARTKQRISHGRLGGTIDCDFQMPGTALAWAVHDNRPHVVKALLELGAIALDNNDTSSMSPLSWAAFYHHHECLKLMIEELENRCEKDPRFALMYTPLHRHAVHGADRFSMILRAGTNSLKNLEYTLDLLREKAKLITFAKNFGGVDQTLFYFAVAGAHDEVVNYMLVHKWHTEDINTPCGELLRTPVLEAIRWCRMPLVAALVRNGADIHVRGANPYYPETLNWSALHVLAHEGHDVDSDMIVERLLGYGLHVDGGSSCPSPAADMSFQQEKHGIPGKHISPESLSDDHTRNLHISELPVETPLSCALRSNAFRLCSTFIKHGASTTALSHSSGLYRVANPTTILGHMIISNLRYSLPRLRYLFEQHAKDLDTLFTVEPARSLSALHRAAMANDGVWTTFDTAVARNDFDLATNHEILSELLKHFGDAKFVNARCMLRGKTSLMLSLEFENFLAARMLIQAGADVRLTDDDGRSALDYVKEAVKSLRGLPPSAQRRWISNFASQLHGSI